MAELTINAEDVRNALNEFAASYEPGNAERVEVGRVVSASDSIGACRGPSLGYGRMTASFRKTAPSTQNLDTRNIGVIVLGDFTGEGARSLPQVRSSRCPLATRTSVALLKPLR